MVSSDMDDGEWIKKIVFARQIRKFGKPTWKMKTVDELLLGKY